MNYPDDIENYTCKKCRELMCSCTCAELAAEEKYKGILYGDDEDDYCDMFDSIDSNDVIILLRNLHQNNNKENTNLLVARLESMLISYVGSSN